MRNAELTNLLTTGAEELGVPLSDEQVRALFVYLEDLKKWNRKINLTAITGEREMVIKHVLDSLSFITVFAPQPGMRLLDMGSGAGLPAIPIRIACPEVSITLVESVKKKGSFLRHIIRTLALTESTVLDARTEELPNSYEASYDVVTARAFADIESAVASGTRLLKPGGLIVLSRGPEERLREHDLNAGNVVLDKKVALTLPHSDYRRVIWVFRRNR